ncbi:MAG: phosphotransferase [Opitutales bacterium]|nr:phosphotransferase [Opitutales bacterium]
MAEEILKGGGTRRFFRIEYRSRPAVACVYDDSKYENFLYAGIAAFLERIGVPAPKVFFHDREKHLLVMEDLGAVDLYLLQTSDAPDWRKAYRLALDSLARLHKTPLEALAGTEILQDGFNDAYYLWEQQYFLDNAAIPQTGVPAPALLEELSQLRQDLLALPRQLLHRDCQSQNIMWHDGNAVFIDFQGMRAGTGFYDVASLLFDPYVEIVPADREAFFEYYCARMNYVPATVKTIFYKAAAQRLMQALGAYYFLSQKMGKTRYLAFVEPALARLEYVSKDTLPELNRLVKTLRGL